MALLFAEHGITVSLKDPSEETVDSLLEAGRNIGVQDKLQKHLGYEELCKSLGSPRVFIFSLPHGSVGDTVIEGLHPYLTKGDIILDASNEHWENTQRRQGKLVAQGVYYIGMGVSGGYQAARRGPSMCPGGQNIALDKVMPLLKKVAAKDGKARPCVAQAGVGGSGHYVKVREYMCQPTRLAETDNTVDDPQWYRTWNDERNRRGVADHGKVHGYERG